MYDWSAMAKAEITKAAASHGITIDCDERWDRIARHLLDHIEELQTALRSLIAAHDSGDLQFNSPEIDNGPDCYSHRWHEAWLYCARITLGESDEQRPKD